MTSLCATSLTQLTYLNESVQLCLVSTKISCIYIFLSWVKGLLVLGYCPSPHIILWVLHVTPAFQELAKQTIISFIGCSQGIQLKDLWSNVLPAFHVSWMDLYSEFYDRWLQTAHNLRASNHFTWSTNISKMFSYKAISNPLYSCCKPGNLKKNPPQILTFDYNKIKLWAN